MLENESDWKFPKDFIAICQHDHHFNNLYKVALDLACRKPKVIFESNEFLEMEEDHLIRLLKCDDLELEELEIWEYLIKWGVENTDSILSDDLTKWTPMDFTELEKILHNCIPHIRFFQMSPEQYEMVKTKFKNILPDGLDDDVCRYFLNPNNFNPSKFKVLPLRTSAYRFDSILLMLY